MIPYLLDAARGAAIFAVALFVVATLARRAPAAVRRAVLVAAFAAAERDAGARARVAISDEVDAPAVAGLFSPVILMPRAALAWSEQRWRLVLLHELAHARAKDCLANALAQIACALHWFDPLAWI